MRQILRLCAFVCLLVSYAGGALIFHIVFRNPFRTRKWIGRWLRLHARLTLEAFGIHVNSELLPLKLPSPAFIVSNHLGYLDALVISSLLPVSFVTSIEMHDTFFIGQITKLAGCLYVERRNKENIHNEISMLTEALNNGVNVCVFPEATSTNGESVLRFRKPLYTAAIQSKTPVIPLCLNYESIDGLPVRSDNRDLLFWYDNMPFFSHLWSLWNIRDAHVRVTFGQPILTTSDAASVAEESHLTVSSHFRPIVSATL